MKDVDHEVHIVEQHPARLLEPLDVPGPGVEFLHQPLLDPLRDRADLDVALAAHQHEPVGGRGQLAQVEQRDVAALALDRFGRGGRRQLADVFRVAARVAAPRGPGQPSSRSTRTMIDWLTCGWSRTGTSNSPRDLIGWSSLMRVRSISKPKPSSRSGMSAIVTEPYSWSSSPAFSRNSSTVPSRRAARASASTRSRWSFSSYFFSSCITRCLVDSVATYARPLGSR